MNMRWLQESPPVALGEPLQDSDSQQEYGSFEYHGEKYSLGDGVYVPCDTHKFPVKSSKHTPSKPTQRNFPDPSDEVTYPELYRKSEYIKGSNSDVPTPFQIGWSHSMLTRALSPSLLLHI